MFELSGVYKNGVPFSQTALQSCLIDHIRGDRKILFITFENADPPAGGRADPRRLPWGLAALLKCDVSVLGVKPFKADWYRGDDLHAFFKSPSFRGFATSFQKIVLYGSSMGGFAALAFAEACDNADVVALNPQTTLDPRKVPWETRFQQARDLDWSGAFCDGAIGARSARKVYVAYDPLFALDRAQVARLSMDNVTELKIPLVKHSIPVWLLQMGVLREILTRVVDDDLPGSVCNRLARKRRNIARYYIGMADKTRSLALKRWCIEKAKEIGPIDTNLCLDILDIQTFTLDLADALATIGRLIEFGVDPTKKVERLFESLARRRRFSDVVVLSDEPVLRNCISCRTRILVAEALINLGRRREASSRVTVLLEEAPENGQCWRVAARLSLAEGSRAEALAYAEQATRHDPLSIAGWDLVGSLQLALGRKTEAQASFAKVLDLDPENRGASEKMRALTI